MIHPPQYHVPEKQPDLGSIHWGIVGRAAIFFVIWNQAITTFLGVHFLFQRGLGVPTIAISGFGVYPPWQWLVWFAKYAFAASSGFSVRMFLAGGLIAAMLGFCICGWILRIGTALAVKRALQGQEHLHGSASFADAEEIRETGALEATEGVLIGGWQQDARTLRYLFDNTDGHVLAFSMTGSGKTAGLAAPVALSNPHRSMLIYDIKGELHKLTSGYRKAAGNAVFRFSPVEENTSRFNLFGEIRLGTMMDVRDAQNIAHMHCHVPGESGAGESHWNDIAASLVTGVILHEAYKARNENRIATGRDILRALNSPDVTFETVLGEMVKYKHDAQGQYGWSYRDAVTGLMTWTGTHPTVRQAAMAMLNRVTKEGPNNEYSSCLSTAIKRFELYADPLITNATRHSDFSVDDLVNHEQPVTVYLVVPLGDKNRLLPLMRTMLTMMFHRLTEISRVEVPNRHNLVLLVDEFPQLKNMEIFSELLPLARGFGIKAYLICQSMNQITEVYGPYNSIADHCNVVVTYTPNELNTADYISRRTGVRTVTVQTASFSGDRYGAAKKSMSTHEQHVERALLTPDEVMRIRPPRKKGDRVVEPGDMLIFITGHRPIYGRQTLYFFDPEFQRRAGIAPLEEWSNLRKGISTAA